MRKHPLANCEECPLYQEPVVEAFGPENADIVVVGEAPGRQEVAAKEPFVGASGQLLNTVLNHYSIDRTKVKLTNAVICRPPNNRTPTPAEIRNCRPRLVDDLKDAKTILTLGSPAVQSVMNTKEGIMKLRAGPPKTSPEFPSAKIVPTVHPALCLRQADNFPLLVADIGKIKNPPVQWKEPLWKAYEDPPTAINVLAYLYDQNKPISLDIETAVEKDDDYSHPSDVLCVGLSYDEGKAVVIGHKALQNGTVRHWLSKLVTERPIITQNGKYDLGVLGKGKVWYDTMLASYALDERPGVHGLKYQSKELLGAPEYANEIHVLCGKGSYGLALQSEAGTHALYKYNAIDAANTYTIANLQLPKLQEENLLRLEEFLVDASNALMQVERKGVRVDFDYLNVIEADYLQKLKDLETDMSPWVANPRSWQQIKAAYSKMGIETPSTDVEHLEGILLAYSQNDEAQRFTDLLMTHRKEQKQYGTYVKGIKTRSINGRVFPTFLLHGSVSGRLACRNPNLQNVPRGDKLRRLFIPDDGNVFIQADYAAAELRVMAVEAKDEFLLDIFREGRDIHNEFSDILFGKGRWTKEHRIRTKAFVFGIGYGREAFSIATEFGISVYEAQQHMNTFLQMIPGVVKWKKQIKEQVLHGHEDLITHFGRHRRFWLITRQNAKEVEKEAYSFIPQSTASDIGLTALIQLVKDGIDVKIPVHDSILVECAIKDREEVSHHLRKTMMEAARSYTDLIEFPVDLVLGPSWGDLAA